MKKLFALFITLATSGVAFAQNTFPSSGSVGIGTTSPNSSSLLDMTSTTKGMLTPRMTKAQRDAISSPATGLMIYQTDNTAGFYYYAGIFSGGWKPVGGAATNLGNLTTTSINQDLLPDGDNTRDIGSSTLSWNDGYFDGMGFFKTSLSVGGTTTPSAYLEITPTTSSTNGLQLNPNSTKSIELRFMELASNGTNYVGFKAPSSIAANKIWTLPAADGTSGQVLTTNGSGTLSWSTVSGGTTGLTTNFVPRWNGSALVDGSIYDNGTKIGLGTVAPSAFLHISESADVDHPQILVRDVATDGYARIYLSSFSNLIGDESKWKILGRTSQTDANNNFLIQQVRNIGGNYVGNTRFYIDYDGKIGLGTSVPTAKLFVNTDFVGDEFIVGPETGTPHYIVDALGQGGYNVTDPNSRLQVNADPGEDALRVQVDGTTKFFVNASGNVGIGTGLPAVKLHLSGTDEVLRLDGTNPYMQFFSSAVAKSYIQQNGNDFRLGTVGTNTSGKVQITAGSSTAMTISSAGNVGIGTTSPTAKLHLKGNSEVMKVEGTDPFIQFYNGTAASSFIWRTGNDFKMGTSTGNNTGKMIFGTAPGGDQLFLLPDGTVGVGTTATAGYKLAIDGKVVCEELKVKLSQNWPDYVFDDGYKLPSLKEVEHSIRNQKHLPGIPSASEIHEEGLNVGDMQKVMMQKIEELTLYVIDLQKQNDALRAAVSELNPGVK